MSTEGDEEVLESLHAARNDEFATELLADEEAHLAEFESFEAEFED